MLDYFLGKAIEVLFGNILQKAKHFDLQESLLKEDTREFNHWLLRILHQYVKGDSP